MKDVKTEQKGKLCLKGIFRTEQTMGKITEIINSIYQT